MTREPNLKLKSAIQSRGIKGCYLAKEIGVSPKTFSRFLHGYRNLSTEKMEVIASILRMSFSDLFNAEENNDAK